MVSVADHVLARSRTRMRTRGDTLLLLLLLRAYLKDTQLEALTW